MTGRSLSILAAAGGCAADAPPWTPPLLGQRSPSIIAHLAEACPRPLEELTLGAWTSPLAAAPRVDPGELGCAAPGGALAVRFDCAIRASTRATADTRQTLAYSEGTVDGSGGRIRVRWCRAPRTRDGARC